MTEQGIKIIRTWPGAPLRQMAATKASATFIPYAKPIDGCTFAGRYVCDCCLQPCSGVIQVIAQDDCQNSGNRHPRWLCHTCEAGGTRKVITDTQRLERGAKMRAGMHQ